MDNKAKLKYQEQIAALTAEISFVKKRIDRVSRLRLLLFAAELALFILLCIYNYYGWAMLSLLVFILPFIALVVHHGTLDHKLSRKKNLLVINERGLARLNGEWRSFADNGEDLIQPDHPFAGDLDIAGPGSLFQWISSCQTSSGRIELFNKLSGNISIDEAEKRQAAVKELSDKVDWRQEFECAGMLANSPNSEERLLEWNEDVSAGFNGFGWTLLAWGLPVVTLIVFIVSYVFFRDNMGFVLILLLIQYIIALLLRKKFSRNFKLAGNVSELAGGYADMFRLLDSVAWESELLSSTVSRESGSESPAKILSRLNTLVDYANLQKNPLFHFIINTLTLWDLHCARALEKWLIRNAHMLPLWLKTIGHFESVSSLANLSYENETWSWPVLKSDITVFDAKALGHPLLQNDRVVLNDFTLDGHGRLMVLTGSNMSGKSTFLRSVGLAIVLSYSGAPVCANSLQVSEWKLYASMRLKDNVEANISSFYAELLRLKMIINAAATGEPVFFLIDEIFRGTNSRDRIEGAVSAMTHLCQLKGSGIITTHDLELANDGIWENASWGKNEEPKLPLYAHFQENYQGDRLNFDYILKPGMATSSNARFLMKLVGIE